MALYDLGCGTEKSMAFSRLCSKFVIIAAITNLEMKWIQFVGDLGARHTLLVLVYEIVF